MYLPDRESLKERFEQYSDEQLTEILKNRRDYQEQALEAAIEAALARGLINSREDLFSPKFNQPRSHRRAFFPLLNERQTARTVKSLFRIIYLITIVPAAFSMLSYAEGNFLQLLLWAVAAVAWAGTALLTERGQNEHMVWLLAAIFFGFHIIWFISQRYSIGPDTMDLVIYGLSLLLFFYVMGYLYVLLHRIKKN